MTTNRDEHVTTERNVYRLALLRTLQRHGLTQDDVGVLVGKDRSSVSNYCSGRFPVSLTLAVELCKAGCPELLEAACKEAGGRFVPDDDVDAPGAAEREALAEVNELVGRAHRYIDARTRAVADGVVTPSEHTTLELAVGELRRLVERLERGHHAGAQGGLRAVRRT